jgi:hypothetical protein
MWCSLIAVAYKWSHIFWKKCTHCLINTVIRGVHKFGHCIHLSHGRLRQGRLQSCNEKSRKPPGDLRFNRAGMWRICRRVGPDVSASCLAFFIGVKQSKDKALISKRQELFPQQHSLTYQQIFLLKPFFLLYVTRRFATVFIKMQHTPILSHMHPAHTLMHYNFETRWIIIVSYIQVRRKKPVLGPFVKTLKATVSFVVSVFLSCPSAWTNFHENRYF